MIQTELSEKNIGLCCSCGKAFHGEINDKTNLNSHLNIIKQTIDLLKKIPDEDLLEKIKLTLPLDIENKKEKKSRLQTGSYATWKDGFHVHENNFFGHRNRKSERVEKMYFQKPEYEISIQNINYLNYYNLAFGVKMNRLFSKSNKEEIKRLFFEKKQNLNSQILEYLNFNKITQQIIELKVQNETISLKKKKEKEKEIERKPYKEFFFEPVYDEYDYLSDLNSSDSEFPNKRIFITDSSSIDYYASDSSDY